MWWRRTEIRRLTMPTGLAVSPDGKFLSVSNSYSNTVSMISVS